MDERRPPTADFKFKFRCLPDEEVNEERERPVLPSLLHISLFFGCHKSFVLLLFFYLSPAFLSLFLSIAQATRKPFRC